MRSPLGPAGAVPLAAVERSGMSESVHSGAAVVLGPGGEVAVAHGDVDAPVYARSTLKFVQAAAVLGTGVELSALETALASASHRGTARHVAVVEGLLHRLGLSSDDLRCPAEWPGDAAARRARLNPSRLTMNCSGKHAAFLAACVHAGWTTADYLDPAHPLQRRVVAEVERLGGEPVAHSGVDGCGAPVHAVGLAALARATAGALRARPDLANAVRAHPWAVDGEGGANTRVIRETGVVAKRGAEGMLVLVAPNGTTVALKVLDGSSRASTTVGLALLVQAGALDAGAARRADEPEPVIGGGEPVGRIRPLVGAE